MTSHGMTLKEFRAHLADLDWPSAARTIAGALEAAPVGTQVGRATKEAQGPLKWREDLPVIKRNRQGVERIVFTPTWTGAWSFGVEAALPSSIRRHPEKSAEIVEAAYHLLRRADALPAPRQAALAL